VLKIATRDLFYSDLDAELTGVLHWNAADSSPRPGILLVHGGAGLDEHARAQARRYAELGYTVLAADMYGVAGNRERIVSTVTALRDDPALLLRRARAGLAALADCPEAESRVAVVGFCFGGLVALALARAGTDLAAAVSIHGSLATAAPGEPGRVAARVLACHGAADPHVPMSEVTAFADEMDRAAADWQLIVYGRAQHGFTHANAIPGQTPGVAYDPVADSRSFLAATAFLADAFGCSALPGEQAGHPVGGVERGGQSGHQDHADGQDSGVEIR
jgi:dienelactone hydrolase